MSIRITNASTVVISSGVYESGAIIDVGELYIESGGTAYDTVVGNIGTLVVMSGGTAENVSAAPYASVYVEPGGKLTSAEMASSSFLYMQEGASVLDLTLSSGAVVGNVEITSGLSGGQFPDGQMQLSSGIVLTNSAVYVSGGGVLYGDTLILADGAIVYLATGGTATQINISSALFQLSGATNSANAPRLSSALVGSQGAVLVSGAGYVNSVTVSDGGSISANGSGAEVSVVSVFGGDSDNPGVVSVGNSAIITQAWLFAGGMLIVDAASGYNITISSGGSVLVTNSGAYVSNVILNYGGELTVQSGCTALAIDWNPISGGTLIADSGAVITYVSTLKGYFYNYPGGDISGLSNTNMVVSGGGLLTVMSSGRISGCSVLEGGSVQVYSGGRLLDSVGVDRGAIVSIYTGGSAVGVCEKGGYLTFDDGATVEFSPSVESDLFFGYLESVTVHSNTIFSNVVIGTGCQAEVFSGGSVVGAQVSGGFIYVHSAGILESAMTIPFMGGIYAESGAVVTYSPTPDGVYLGSYATPLNNYDLAESGSVLSGTSLYLIGTGNFSSLTLYNDAYLEVSRVVVDDVVLSGGSVRVCSGAVLSGAEVHPGTYLYVYSGGSAVDVSEMGGFVEVQAGGAGSFTSNELVDLVISSSSATAHSSTIISGGTVVSGLLVINSGGSLNTYVVGSAGYLILKPGAVVGDISIDAGTVQVSGGILSSVVVSDGVLELSATGIGNGVSMLGGAVVVGSGANVSNITLVDGVLSIQSGGVASQVVVSGGSMQISDGGSALGVDWTPGVGDIFAETAAVVSYNNPPSGVYHTSSGVLVLSAGIMSAPMSLGLGERLYVMSGGILDAEYIVISGNH